MDCPVAIFYTAVSVECWNGLLKCQELWRRRELYIEHERTYIAM